MRTDIEQQSNTNQPNRQPDENVLNIKSGRTTLGEQKKKKIDGYSRGTSYSPWRRKTKGADKSHLTRYGSNHCSSGNKTHNRLKADRIAPPKESPLHLVLFPNPLSFSLSHLPLYRTRALYPVRFSSRDALGNPPPGQFSVPYTSAHCVPRKKKPQYEMEAEQPKEKTRRKESIHGKLSSHCLFCQCRPYLSAATR